MHLFGPLPHTTLIMSILRLLNNLRKILKTDFSNGKSFPFNIFDLVMASIPREIFNPLHDITK